MAITVTPFTNNAQGSSATATTAIKTWTTGHVFLITVLTFIAGTPAIPTLTGSTQLVTQLGENGVYQTTLFVFLGDGTTHAKTITCGASQTEIQWICDDLNGVIATGTNGSNAVVQSVPATNAGSTTITATLAAFADAVNNVTYMVAANAGGETQTPKAGFTAGSTNSAFLVVGSEYKIGQDTTPNFTQPSANNWTAIALELAATGGGGGGGGAFFSRAYYEQLVAR